MINEQEKKAKFLRVDKKILLRLAGELFIFYLLIGLGLFFFQKKMVYYPDNENFESCSGFNDAQKVNFKGTRMYYKAGNKKLIVFYHGNARSACWRAFTRKDFDKNGYSYIFVEYAGFAQDPRPIGPNIGDILQDVRNVNEYIKTIDHDELILIGESIGTGPASYHSTLVAADKLILVSPYNKLADVAQLKIPVYPISWILTENYNNEAWLKNFKGNLLILHGRKDDLIPPYLAQRLFNSVNARDKKFVMIEQAAHGDILYSAETWKNIINFIGSKE